MIEFDNNYFFDRNEIEKITRLTRDDFEKINSNFSYLIYFDGVLNLVELSDPSKLELHKRKKGKYLSSLNNFLIKNHSNPFYLKGFFEFNEDSFFFIKGQQVNKLTRDSSDDEQMLSILYFLPSQHCYINGKKPKKILKYYFSGLAKEIITKSSLHDFNIITDSSEKVAYESIDDYSSIAEEVVDSHKFSYDIYRRRIFDKKTLEDQISGELTTTLFYEEKIIKKYYEKNKLIELFESFGIEYDFSKVVKESLKRKHKVISTPTEKNYQMMIYSLMCLLNEEIENSGKCQLSQNKLCEEIIKSLNSNLSTKIIESPIRGKSTYEGLLNKAISQSKVMLGLGIKK